MSVLLPWNRKRPSAGKEVSRVLRHSPRTQTGFGPFGLPPRVAILAAVLTVVLTLIPGLAPAAVETIWECQGRELLWASRGRYLFGQDGALTLWESSHGNRLSAMRADDNILGWLDSGLMLTFRPRRGLGIGEPWIVNAVLGQGAIVWEQTVPGFPFAVAQEGARLVVGVVDLSAGGVPAVVELDAETGRVAWTRILQDGLWRGLGFTAGGLVVAVLDTGIVALGGDGSSAWRKDLPTPITTALVTHDAIIVSTPGKGLLARIISPHVLEAISFTGASMWIAALPGRPHSIGEWPELGGSGLSSGAVVALRDTLVIGFSMRDGECLFAKRIGFRPVSIWGDYLLVETSQGFRLVKFEVPDPPGGTRIP